MDLNKELVVISLPPSLDWKAYCDYDQEVGVGGAEQILLETEDGVVVITTKVLEADVRTVIRGAEAYYK